MQMHPKLLAVALLSLTALTQAHADNVVLGKTVSASGAVGVITPTGTGMGWCDAGSCPPAALSTLTDGVSLADGTHWQMGTVWWDEHEGGSSNVTFDIELGGVFEISSVLLQGDNNDKYAFQYRDFSGTWHSWVYATETGGWGLSTRAGGVPPVHATALRIDAYDGDAFYSLSEIQANGSAVPEPAGLALVGIGALAAALAARRRRA